MYVPFPFNLAPLTGLSGGFIPLIVPALIALLHFALSATINWIQFFSMGRQRYMLNLTLGMTAMTIGFILRIFFAKSPLSLGLFLTMDMALPLSWQLCPCAFLALDYVIFARLVNTFDEKITQNCLLIRPARIVRLFLWSDYITFMLQGNGGGLTASKTAIVVKIGTIMTMIGLCLQFISFLFFTWLLVVFGWRVRKRFPAAWNVQPGSEPFTLLTTRPVADWRILYWTLLINCNGILLRCSFRIAEYGMGPNGFIALHEAYFYSYDTLALWISMSLYCIVWPPRFLSTQRSGDEGMELREAGEGDVVRRASPVVSVSGTEHLSTEAV
ncbi:RTA1 like protein-domain-containing protein [Mycena capillaripes]|nr:RTA1 like protein-domain-containing protein [Mycena capillaripes]